MILYRNATDEEIIEADGELTWYAFDAEVVDYKDNDWIRVVFPAEIVEKIQANGGLIAIVSQSAGAFQR